MRRMNSTNSSFLGAVSRSVLRGLAIVLVTGLISGPSTAWADDIVLRWNEIAARTATATSPFNQARVGAIVQLAVFEAVNAIRGEYDSYLNPPIVAPSGASLEAAVTIAAQETADLVEDGSSSASTGLSVLGRKALEHAQFNAEAYVGHVSDLMSARSIPEVIDLNTAFAKQVAETLAAQAREFSELAQKTATEAVESIKTRFEKSFKRAA